MPRRSPLAFALMLGLSLVGCGPKPHPDTAQRPNQPMFIDPIEDLKPQDRLGGGSWFAISTLRAGDREFGILIHYLKTPTGTVQTLAITDANTGKYYLDEAGKPKFSTRDHGFEVTSDNLRWSATDTGMQIRGSLASGEAFDLTMHRVGPVLSYNGTGNFPLIDDAMPTWEYAFPVMETVGTVTIGKTRYQVTGNSWFDRQWFAPTKEMAALSSGKASWSWIATRLPNGDVLAVWDTVGARERTWANVLRPDGTLTIADAAPLTRGMSGVWTSSRSGVRWPSEWSVVIPGTQTNLVVKATSQGQETFKGMPRIEALSHISGTYEGRQISTVGYVEMLNKPNL